MFAFGDGINSVTWALLGDCFGRTSFGAIRGWISMFQSFASMPAAVLTGWIGLGLPPVEWLDSPPPAVHYLGAGGIANRTPHV